MLDTDAQADALGKDQDVRMLTGDRQSILVPAALSDSKDAITTLPVIDYTAHRTDKERSSSMESRR